MQGPEEQEKSAYLAAFSAYLIWGLIPLYLILVRTVPPFEFVGWRIIWTVPICLLIVALRNQRREVYEALCNPRILGWLVVSALLVGGNWLVYIWAIQEGHVYATSVGYYINPLVNVLLGTVFLHEKLSRRQWIAVALATVGVVLLLFGGALTTLWVGLWLALTFSFYGMVRKRVPVGALPGLTIESIVLFVPAWIIVGSYAAGPSGMSFGGDLGLSLAIVLGGVLTAIPLLCFAVAARRLPYSTMGFIQFLAPSIVFVLGLTVFGERLDTTQLTCFLFIWAAVAIFVSDLVSRQRKVATSS